ncbi:MAG: hypothetical protein IKF97_06340, partial [Clostridia bacterium]|nr:hypothetical protein [Clostridia bacterium]
MKKNYDITLSYNPNINTHTLKRIVAHYYKEYVELDDEFENMTEDEYSKMMIAKAENAKTEKERNKIAEEYAKNMKKYYPLSKPYSILNYNNQVNKLNGYIAFKYQEIEEQLELPLLDFISYDLNNINEYIVFFINYFDIVKNVLDKDVLKVIELNTLYEIKFISDIAKNYYDKVVKEVSKMQTIFRMCIDLVYQLNINEYTKKLSKDLTKEQRFYVFNQTNNKPFKDISNNYKAINSLDYTYEYIDTRIPELVISILKSMDPEGKDISHEYKYETDNLFTAFYIMLYNIIGIKNWNVKKCGNCGRYFLTPKETISYCDRIFSDNMTCREYGNMDYQRKKRELDETYRKYRDISAKIQTRISRGKKKKDDVSKFEKDLD